MCGINGIYAYHYAANPIDRDELIRTRDHMRARGPDGAGIWLDAEQRVGLGHRRLAIVDLTDAGAQPMVSADGRLIVTFNGEIYNYSELRRALEQKGRQFRSNCDTEVLLHLYAEKGPEMVHELRGMFAFAIWDSGKRSLFLARDPLGIKPLYYCDDGWTFRFASQVKALLAGGAVSREPDQAGLVGFYLWGSVPEPFTTWLAINSLPAGCHMMVDRLGGCEPVRYHSVARVYYEAEGKPGISEDAGEAAMREALLDSVRHHLMADVPIGVFLSAGIDSGAILGLMHDAGQRDIQTITLAFKEFRESEDDESALAATVAQRYGAKHVTRIISQDEFELELPRFMEAMDQPTIDGLNTWFVSKAASELGLKVALSGLGGDELFGGYPSFRSIPKWVRWMAIPSRLPLLGSTVQRALAAVPPNLARFNPKVAGMVSMGGSYAGAYQLRRGLFMPWELGQLGDVAFLEKGLVRLNSMLPGRTALVPSPRTSHGRIAALETQLYMRNQLLRDSDWASMAHGLEIRVPLVDSVLLAKIAPLLIRQRPGGGKHLLARSPKVSLPRAVVNRSKTGFSTPLARWQKRSLAPHSSRHTWPWARHWARHVASAQGHVS